MPANSRLCWSNAGLLYQVELHAPIDVSPLKIAEWDERPQFAPPFLGDPFNIDSTVNEGLFDGIGSAVAQWDQHLLVLPIGLLSVVVEDADRMTMKLNRVSRESLKHRCDGIQDPHVPF